MLVLGVYCSSLERTDRYVKSEQDLPCGELTHEGKNIELQIGRTILDLHGGHCFSTHCSVI